MQLDLNLLTALDALLEEESVTGAAERLHLSAPAMSRSLGRLRRATGDQILVRNGRIMRPTPRAVALRAEVRALVLRSREVLTPEAPLDLAALRRTFTLRAHDALTVILAPELVHRVSAAAPGVGLRFLGEAAGDSTDLRRGMVDLEIGSAAPVSPDIDRDDLGHDQLVGLARTGHQLLDSAGAGARGEAVDLQQWIATPHVLVSRRGRLRDRTDEQLEAAGHSRTVVAAVASTAAAVEIVRHTDAVVVMPAAVAARLTSAGGVAEFALPVQVPPVRVVLAWHHHFTADHAHQWLRALTRDVLTTHRCDRTPAVPDRTGQRMPPAERRSRAGIEGRTSAENRFPGVPV
ncbi:LysR family transcriptional regulator [Nakamurella deserti]|uniref:LysR family transcriptional regulator n=1 Tax=Nakamurella deserti TaxID=2164074 RepID=UPI000DBE0FF9|nr:LysR substrate-binding domain-containing protein [Nakamurella deserti]